MKTIFKGNPFSIVWNIIDRSTSHPFEFTGIKVEVGLYSDSFNFPLQSYNVNNGTITAGIEANTLPAGVFNIMCRYSTDHEQSYCTYRNAFQISSRPCHASEIVEIESYASHIDPSSEDPDAPDYCKCQLIAEELFGVKLHLPELTAHRAIADENGNRIPDTYVTRQGLTEHIKETYNQQFLENPPLITEGYITPGMLSEETRQMLEATGQEITNLPDGEDLQAVHGVLKLANKRYNPGAYSGLGRQYLRKNIVAGVNILTQSMMQWPNTIYIIQYDYDLQGAEITIPEGCVLDFQGGSLNNGTLLGTYVSVIADSVPIFGINMDFNVKLNVEFVNALWFGAKGDGLTDNTHIFNYLFNQFVNIYIPKGEYLTKTIEIKGANSEIHITGDFNYNNRGAVKCTKLVQTGGDYIIKFSGACYNSILEKLLLVVNADSLGGIYYNDVYHTLTQYIGIDNYESTVNKQAVGITIAGSGYSNLFTQIQCRYLHMGIKTVVTNSSDWLNNLQFGVSKGDIYIVRGDYGIELQKGAGVILEGVAIEYMSKDAIVINDIGSLGTMNVFYNKGYIETIKGSTFNLIPRTATYGGINLFVNSIEFHTPAIDNFCVNNGTNRCFVKIQDCTGISFSGQEHKMFKGNLLLDLINKTINSAENIHYFNSPLPLHENYVDNSKYISSFATKAITLGSADSEIYGSFNLSKTTTMTKGVLLRTTWNRMRRGELGTFSYPLAVTNRKASAANKYIYKARLYMYKIADDKLSNQNIDYDRDVCCVDLYSNGEKNVVFGEEIFNSFGFSKFYISDSNNIVSGTKSVTLVIYNYIGSTTPTLDYSLGIIAEIECIGTPFLNGIINNYGGDYVRNLRDEHWKGYDTVFDTATKKWIEKQPGETIWKDVEGNIIY